MDQPVTVKTTTSVNWIDRAHDLSPRIAAAADEIESQGKVTS